MDENDYILLISFELQADHENIIFHKIFPFVKSTITDDHYIEFVHEDHGTGKAEKRTEGRAKGGSHYFHPHL